MSVHQFTVLTDQPVGECYRFWDVANWNKPFRLLDPKHIKRLRGYAPFCDAVNCVYLLGGRTREHNCWYQGLDADGRVMADFAGMIAQLQAALDNGYTPWLVLDNIPYRMSDPPDENFYGNTAPPGDERVWHQYVKAAIEAMVEAFGRQVVERWWFRVGTEPDLAPGHWTGTKQQYFDHYDYTVDAVLSVLSDAMIGPGNILNPVEGEYGIIVEDQWGLDIIDHCATGRNACTGETGTPMRWFTCSWYGRVGVPLSMFDQAIEMMRTRLAKYPQLADVPVIIGEFTVLHDENGTRLHSGDTTEWSASFYAGIADRAYHYNIEKIYEWHHGTDGVLHPKGHVITMLEQMAEGERLKVDPPGQRDIDYGVIVSRLDGELFVLVYHHDTPRQPADEKTLHITINEVSETSWTKSEWTVDSDHASWAYEYQADCQAGGVQPMAKAGRFEGGIEFIYGEPGFDIWNANREKYAALSVLPQTNDAVLTMGDDGSLDVEVPMPGHCVRLIRLTAGA